MVPVPLLSPSLSSRWLALVTNVDVATGRALIDSMTNEVVVRDDSIRALVPFEPMDYDTAVLAALGERAKLGKNERGRCGPPSDGDPFGDASTASSWAWGSPAGQEIAANGV